MRQLGSMETNKEISSWLANPEKDYAQGAALYNKYGKSKHLARLFVLKHSIGSYQEKIIYELGKLAELPAAAKKPVRVKKVAAKAPKAKPVPPTVQEIEKAVKVPKSTFTAEEFDALPDEVKELEKQWKQLYKERAHVRAALPHLPEQEDRKKAALLILQQGTTIQQIFDDIQYYKDHGFLPDRKALEKQVPDTLAEVTAEIPRTRSRISRNKNKKTEEAKAKLNADQDYLELLLQKRTELESNG